MKKKIFSFWKWLRSDKKRIVTVVGVLLVLIVAAGYLIYNSTKNKTQYQTSLVEKGNIVSSISVSGSVVTANLFNITTSATGIVKEVYVKDGEKVFAGQKIAEIVLDASGTQASSQSYSSYLSAKNSVDSATTSLWTLQSQAFAANQKFINDAAARSLATNDPTYIQEWADWKAAEEKYNHQSDVINQVKISLNNAWLNYKNVSPIIYAPSAGIISNLSITEGLNLSSADQKIGIIKIVGNPLALFNVSEIDIAKIKVGQKATIILDSLSDKTFTGKVVTVDRSGVNTSGVTNYPVIIRFDTEAEDLLPNMSATANIILETKSDVLLVPSSALHTLNGENSVTILKNGKEEALTVVTGISSDSQIEIISGISEGDQVVISVNTTNTTQSGSTRSVFSSGNFGGGGATRIIGR